MPLERLTRLGPTDSCYTDGVHIGATSRIRWIDVCRGGGNAGCRYRYCSNLFDLFLHVSVVYMFLDSTERQRLADVVVCSGPVLDKHIWGAWPLPFPPFPSSTLPLPFPLLPLTSLSLSPSFPSFPLEVGPLKYS